MALNLQFSSIPLNIQHKRIAFRFEYFGGEFQISKELNGVFGRSFQWQTFYRANERHRNNPKEKTTRIFSPMAAFIPALPMSK